MSLCASCGTDRSVGCEHFESTDFAGQQQEIIKVSEAAAGVKKVEPYVPAQRDYSMPAEKYRGPSVIMSKGPAGPEGRQGERGLPGRDGKDADISEAIDVATQAMESRLAKFEANVSNLLSITLQKAGVIDLNGHAILLPGPQGKPGLSIKGDPGKDGESIVGPAGRNGVDGQSIVGPAGRDGSITEATKAAREYVERGVAELALSMKEMILQILIDRNVLDADGKAVPGPQGLQGIPGVGKPGNILAAIANCEQMVEAKLKSFREELQKDGLR